MDTTPDAPAAAQQQQQPQDAVNVRPPLLQAPSEAGGGALLQQTPQEQPQQQQQEQQPQQQQKEQQQQKQEQPQEGSGTGQQRRRRRKKRGFASATGGADDQSGNILPGRGDTANMQLQTMAQQAGVWHPWKLTPFVNLPKLDAQQMERRDDALQYLLQINLAFQEEVKKKQEAANAISRREAVEVLSRIYIGNLSREVTEFDLRKAFRKYGGIRECSVKHETTGTSFKGYAFLHFDAPEAAMLALSEMNGVIIGGRNIILGRPNNSDRAMEFLEPLAQAAAEANRIYVTSLHADLSQDDIKTVFEGFGAIRSIEVMPGVEGRGLHQGYGWIEYEDNSALAAVMMCATNFELAGQFVKMCKALSTPAEIKAILAAHGRLPGSEGATAGQTGDQQQGGQQQQQGQTQGQQQQQQQQPQQQIEGSIAAQQALLQQPSAPPAAPQLHAPQQNIDMEENLTIRGSQRFMIMQKLQRGDTGDETSSPVIQLSNMVTAKDVDATLEDEIRMECIKHGVVDKIHIHVDIPPSQARPHPDSLAKIFVKFTTPQSAGAAIDALNGRYFDGRVVAAERVSEKTLQQFLGEEDNSTNNKAATAAPPPSG